MHILVQNANALYTNHLFALLLLAQDLHVCRLHNAYVHYICTYLDLYLINLHDTYIRAMYIISDESLKYERRYVIPANFMPTYVGTRVNQFLFENLQLTQKLLRTSRSYLFSV